MHVSSRILKRGIRKLVIYQLFDLANYYAPNSYSARFRS